LPLPEEQEAMPETRASAMTKMKAGGGAAAEIWTFMEKMLTTRVGIMMVIVMMFGFSSKT